jgi:hypothetical protein
MTDLKRGTAGEGRTMSRLVESPQRLLVCSHRKREKLLALPTFADADSQFHASRSD